MLDDKQKRPTGIRELLQPRSKKDLEKLLIPTSEQIDRALAEGVANRKSKTVEEEQTEEELPALTPEQTELMPAPWENVEPIN